MARKSTKQVERERDPKTGGYLHAEKPTKNGHYMGKHCGFEYQDGRYQVARSHYGLMEEASTLEQGLRAMMAAQNHYINSQFNRIAELRDRFWKGVQSDYELPANLLYHGDGWLSIQPLEETPSMCIACGLSGFRGIEALVKHQRECEQHPLGKEIRELRKQLASTNDTERG